MMDQSSLLFWTTWTGVISALATGLGAIPVHFLHYRSKIIRAFSGAFAAGMMLSASVFSLAQEGIELKSRLPWAPYQVILGLLLGAAFFWFAERKISAHHFASHLSQKKLSRKSLLLFLSMFIHSIPEGIAIGVGFATGNFKFGLIMALAISVHNIPEGIAISLPLKNEGTPTSRCALISILSSVPQPIMAAPAALLTWFFIPLLPTGLGFAGGAMVYLIFAELIPDAIKDGGTSLTAWGVIGGLSLMLLITNLLELLPIP